MFYDVDRQTRPKHAIDTACHSRYAMEGTGKYKNKTNRYIPLTLPILPWLSFALTLPLSGVRLSWQDGRLYPKQQFKSSDLIEDDASFKLAQMCLCLLLSNLKQLAMNHWMELLGLRIWFTEPRIQQTKSQTWFPFCYLISSIYTNSLYGFIWTRQGNFVMGFSWWDNGRPDTRLLLGSL